MKKYKSLIIILIISLFLEIFIFNITSYRLLLGNFEKITYNELEFDSYSEDGKTVFLKINNINTKVGTIKLIFENEINLCEYKIYYSDATTSQFLELNSKTYIPGKEKTSYIPVYLSGDTNSLMISINSEIYNNDALKGIIINEKIPFEFNIIRFLTILLFFILIYGIKNARFFREKYLKTNSKQELILVFMLFIFIFILTIINTASSPEENYGTDSLSDISTEGSVYNKDFVEALKNHQFYLLEDPSQEVLDLDDPYDASTRDSIVKSGVDYKWDTALYNGHSYIYFGILPVLLTFLPYNLLTHKYLKISFVILIFSIFIFILLKEILLKLIQRYFKETPFYNVFFALLIILSGTLIFYASGTPLIYEVVIIVGLYFVLQGIYFILNSIEKEKHKYFNIFLGSTFLALSVACRPTDLLASLIILPYFIKLFIINIKNKNIKEIIKMIVGIAIPYLVVGSLLMWYNYVRFDNVFEFGASYQLTIANMNKLGSRIFSIPTGLICNLFSIPNFIYEFPFMVNQNKIMPFYGYYYVGNMIGGLFILSPICFFTFGIFKINKNNHIKLELKKLINILTIVGALICAISIIMAGSTQRYLIDYAYIFVFAGILIYLSIYDMYKDISTKKILKKIFGIIAIYTVIFGILSGIVSEMDYMKFCSPEIYYTLKYSISFFE